MEATHKMQKYLKLLNFRLDVVVEMYAALQLLLSLPTFFKRVSYRKSRTADVTQQPESLLQKSGQ